MEHEEKKVHVNNESSNETAVAASESTEHGNENIISAVQEETQDFGFTSDTGFSTDDQPKENFGDFGNQGFAAFNDTKPNAFAVFGAFDTAPVEKIGFAAYESDNQGFAAFETSDSLKPSGFGDFQNEPTGFADFKTADSSGFEEFKTSTNNDDFGDFGDFEETTNDFGDFEEPRNTGFGEFESPKELVPDFPMVEQHEKESSRIKAILPTESDPFLLKLNQDIENAFVITQEIDSIPLPPKLYNQNDLIEPNTKDDWTVLFKKLQTENIYNDPDIFRWRKSLTRTKFLESISKTITKAERTAQQVEEPKVTGALADYREVELQNAKKLCDISEDEIRKKSKTELRELIQVLQKSLQQMQEQTNYWLDSKEQLVMDAEMHNKMIASLVTYAQQQQQPKVAKVKKGLFNS
ncbi:hypothetical protein HDV06_004309 [Boothiomyces sp. JEL0866]|nr:hypothetical protein HDV06_004309 [Boothiomyces sp. JEL0866]